MRKTAEQLADEVLYKIALSPNRAFQTLMRTAREAPAEAERLGLARSRGLMMDRIHESPLTMARAAEAITGPGTHRMNKTKLYDLLMDAVDEAAALHAKR